MTDDQEKETAFETLKAELRDNVEAREFLHRLALSQYKPREDKNFAGQVADLQAICWEAMIAAGDDYIPVVGHPDPQVCDHILRSMLARLQTEGRPIPRLLRKFCEDLIAVCGRPR